MIKKYLLKRIGKPLVDAGLGDTPHALHRLLHNPQLAMNAVIFAFIEHFGVFDSLGFAFFASRILSKLGKGVTKHDNRKKEKVS